MTRPLTSGLAIWGSDTTIQKTRLVDVSTSHIYVWYSFICLVTRPEMWVTINVNYIHALSVGYKSNTLLLFYDSRGLGPVWCALRPGGSKFDSQPGQVNVFSGLGVFVHSCVCKCVMPSLTWETFYWGRYENLFLMKMIMGVIIILILTYIACNM